MKASITYSIVSPESSEIGDYAEIGMIGVFDNLRDAIKELFTTRTNKVDGIQSIEYGYLEYMGRFQVTVLNGIEFETGCFESRDLFIDGITKSTAKRIESIIGSI